MIERIEISGVHTIATPELQKYVTKKIGKLDRYLPKNARESVHAEVMLKEVKSKNKKQCVCEVIMHVPKETITIKEATINMFASVDIVEAKLRNQLKKYKETHSNVKLHRKLLARIKRKG
jgi:putative sigma-54 modulation protein